MKHNTLERQLFDWTDWDEGAEAGDFQFYKVTFKIQVGEHPAGTTFPVACLLLSQSVLSLYNDLDEVFEYDLKLSVGDKLTADRCKV